MVLFKEAASLSAYLLSQRKSGKSVGFVPTMGALHQGHVSLVELSKSSNEITVCSIFINPTQFNNAEDFRLYPVTIESDIAMLESSGCDVLFLPSVEEIYPAGYSRKHYALGPIETILEGAHRPGHFQGVCQVVERLLDITMPDHLYLGQKDFQQCLVIRKLLQLSGKEKHIQLHIGPTIREKDGLAMSSRNLRLDQQQRNKATAIYKELEHIRHHIDKQDPLALTSAATQQLEQKGFLVDYVEIAHADDLSPARHNRGKLVALVAATLGNVRLIDNMVLN